MNPSLWAPASLRSRVILVLTPANPAPLGWGFSRAKKMALWNSLDFCRTKEALDLPGSLNKYRNTFIVWMLAASTLPDCITGLPPLVDVSLCEVFFWHEVKNCPHFQFIWIYSWKRENHRVECEEQKRGNIDCFHCDLDTTESWICMNTTDQWMITNWIKM